MKDVDLRKSFKEALRTPLTRRIIEFAGPEYRMPTNIKLYDESTDLEDHLIQFASAESSGEWLTPMWCRMFQQTLDGSEIDPHEITKIARNPNESLTAAFANTDLSKGETLEGMDHYAPYPSTRGDYQGRTALVLTLDFLIKLPKEILATETQLRLTTLRPMLNPPKTDNMDRYCDYHQENGHHINDYF
nr:hypothetical protein [Tanacetum cinerariifolium]